MSTVKPISSQQTNSEYEDIVTVKQLLEFVKNHPDILRKISEFKKNHEQLFDSIKKGQRNSDYSWFLN